MKTVVIEIENKINELLDVLDCDIENTQKNLLRLNQLRSLVIKRDDMNLGNLLASIRSDSRSDAARELRRNSIRKELAKAFGCSVEQMTLSRLGDLLPEEKMTRVNQKREKLISLTGELKREHLSTGMLLTECARLNSLLLNNVFNFGKNGTVTYNSNGNTRRQGDAGFVNMQL